MLTVLDLFSGIGGFSLGLEATKQFKTISFCELDPFCQKVLKKHWPNVPIFDDIKSLDRQKLEPLGRIDVVCGGFPCQPVSCAGKRKGDKDERWMWPEFYRIVCEVRPKWVLVENVPGLLNADSGRLFAGILRDLASSGYDAEWNIVSAASVGAPHLRKRVFIVAYASEVRCGGYTEIPRRTCEGENERWLQKPTRRGPLMADSNQIGRHGRAGMFWQGWRRESENSSEEIANTSGEGLPRPKQEREHAGSIAECDWWAVEPDVGRVAHGIPARVDRLRALGNAIVPQCATYIGNCVLDYEKALNSNVSNI